ncbi:MAG: hypothetical protein AB1486_24555 [Planctomycetota bacterium]
MILSPLEWVLVGLCLLALWREGGLRLRRRAPLTLEPEGVDEEPARVARLRHRVARQARAEGLLGAGPVLGAGPHKRAPPPSTAGPCGLAPF